MRDKQILGSGDCSDSAGPFVPWDEKRLDNSGKNQKNERNHSIMQAR